MARSLPNLVNNPSEGVHRTKCKLGHADKKCKTCGMKYMFCNFFLEYINFKDELIEYKCLRCNKNYQHKFDEKLKEQFLNKYTFSNYNNNKFISLLRKGVYPYEYMDDLKKFNKTSLPEKESDTLLLADVFENFRNMCLEIYELDPE